MPVNEIRNMDAMAKEIPEAGYLGVIKARKVVQRVKNRRCPARGGGLFPVNAIRRFSSFR
jgi:hypothetical protein